MVQQGARHQEDKGGAAAEAASELTRFLFCSASKSEKAPRREGPFCVRKQSRVGCSVQEVSTVERIALFGSESSIADQTAQILLCRPMVGAGCGNDVFLDHDAAYIVTAKT